MCSPGQGLCSDTWNTEWLKVVTKAYKQPGQLFMVGKGPKYLKLNFWFFSKAQNGAYMAAVSPKLISYPIWNATCFLLWSAYFYLYLLGSVKITLYFPQYNISRNQLFLNWFRIWIIRDVSHQLRRSLPYVALNGIMPMLVLYEVLYQSSAQGCSLAHSWGAPKVKHLRYIFKHLFRASDCPSDWGW